jgi:hypothetical protein
MAQGAERIRLGRLRLHDNSFEVGSIGFHCTCSLAVTGTVARAVAINENTERRGFACNRVRAAGRGRPRLLDQQP